MADSTFAAQVADVRQRSERQLRVCRLYLADCPNLHDQSWPAQREFLRLRGWGFLPTYVGALTGRHLENWELLSYGDTGLAAGGAGALAFDSARAALNALGLAAGTAAAFGSIWSRSTTATLYLGGSEAMNCIDYDSGPVEAALSRPYHAQTIQTLMEGGNNVLADAQQCAATNSNDSDLPTLTVAIRGWNAAVKVATAALPVATNPVDYLLSERSAVIDKMLAKLNSSPVSISAQQKTIQGYISSAETTANHAVAKATVDGVSGLAPPGQKVINGRVEQTKPFLFTAAGYAATLKGDPEMLLAATQEYATAAGNIGTCSGNAPS